MEIRKHSEKRRYAQIMKYPVLITKESSDSGIQGSVYHFRESATRVYADNILFYVLQGEINCEYEGEKSLLRDNDIIFLCEGRRVQLDTTGAYALLFTLPGTSLLKNQAEIVCNSAGTAKPENYSPLRSLLSEVLKTQYYGGTFFELKLSSLWKQIIYELLTSFRQSGRKNVSGQEIGQEIRIPKKHEKEFGEILYILERDYEKNIKLNELAEHFYYTPSHLSKLFMRYTGMHFTEYLTELRLKKAVPLLTRTRLEIETIAERTGFPNTRSFQQAFQKKYLMRPSEYRSGFSDLSAKDPVENIRLNLREVRDQGFLDCFFENQSSNDTPSTGQIVYLGRFDCKNTRHLDIASRNNILNIYRARDLLLDEVREEIRIMQEEIGYTYLNCHSLLSDDMQTSLSLRISSGSDGRPIYDFSLQEKALRFAKDMNLKMILHLGKVPSALLAEPARSAGAQNAPFVLPADMDVWSDYIRQLLSFLSRRLGDWLQECPALICQVPDRRIFTGDLDPDDFFNMYRHTFEAIKSVLPMMKVGSPSITCSRFGLDFVKKFLKYCKAHKCMPDMLNFVWIEGQLTHELHVASMEPRRLVSETRNILRSLGADPSIPLNLTEYDFGVTARDECDSMVGAVFPLNVTLKNLEYFDNFGYRAATDFTADSEGRSVRFSGGRGVFTVKGERKPIFYSLKYLSLMGPDCIGMGEGYLITRKGSSLRILLYYDIPEQEQTEKFTRQNSADFYNMYPPRHVSADLSGVFRESVLVREEYLNDISGAALETWLSAGGPLLEEEGMDDMRSDSVPKTHAYRLKADNGMIHYQCSLRPFELRYIEIADFYRESNI